MNPRSLLVDDRTWAVLRIVIGIVIAGASSLIGFLATNVVSDMKDRDTMLAAHQEQLAKKINTHTDQLGSIKTTLGEIETFLKTTSKEREEQINGMKEIQADHENRIRSIERVAH